MWSAQFLSIDTFFIDKRGYTLEITTPAISIHILYFIFQRWLFSDYYIDLTYVNKVYDLILINLLVKQVL